MGASREREDSFWDGCYRQWLYGQLVSYQIRRLCKVLRRMEYVSVGEVEDG
jgi:hypothetical protein